MTWHRNSSVCLTNDSIFCDDFLEEPLTSKLKILRIKKREYRDGIKSRETRPGWGEAHNVYKACVGTTEGF